MWTLGLHAVSPLSASGAAVLQLRYNFLTGSQGPGGLGSFMNTVLEVAVAVTPALRQQDGS